LSSRTVEILHEEDEEKQVQQGIQINSNLIAKQVIQTKFCHYCPERTEMTNPISYTFENGIVVQFCNQDELNAWKTQYNR